MTCKKTGAEFEMRGDNIADIDPDYIVSEIRKAEKLNPDAEIYTRPGGFSLDMDSDFELWDNQTIVFYFKRQDGMYREQLRFFGDSDMFFLPGESRVAAPETVYLLEDYLNALKYMPKDEIRRMCPNADLYLIDFVGFSEAEELNRVITYSKDGVTNLGEKLIHIVIGPMHGSDEDGYSGTGDEMIHLFTVRKARRISTEQRQSYGLMHPAAVTALRKAFRNSPMPFSAARIRQLKLITAKRPCCTADCRSGMLISAI